MKTSISSAALAILGLGSLAFGIPMSVARAQQSGTGAPARVSTGQTRRAVPLPAEQEDARPAMPGVPGQRGMMGGMGQPQMMGGPAAMVSDGESLYILQGNRIFRVNKRDLRVAREGVLPMGPPMQQFRQGEEPMEPPRGETPLRGGGGARGGGGGEQPGK